MFGLEVISDFSPRGVALRCGAGVLLLFDPAETKKSHPRMPSHGTEGIGHVAFLATEDELPGWREHLAQCEVEIETEVGWEVGGRSIYIRDPGGNSVELAPPTLWGGGWESR